MMLEIEQNGKRAALILFMSGTVFIISSTILFITNPLRTECVVSFMLGIMIGIFALFAGFYGRNYKVIIKIDDEQLTMSGPRDALKEFKMEDIEKVEIVRKGRRSSITLHPWEKPAVIIESAGIAENDMEKLISAVKDAGYSHDFDVVEMGSGKKRKYGALLPEKMEESGENHDFSVLPADEDDIPYKVK